MAIPSDHSLAESEAAKASQPSTVNVNVVFMGELQRWAGQRALELEIPPESTIGMLGKRLLSLCGANFARHALTREGSFQPHVAVFVNGVQIGRLGGTKTILTGGQVELMLLPSYEGG